MNFLPYRTEHIIQQLIDELEDAVSFMETFEDGPEEWMGDEGYERLERKKSLLEMVMGYMKDGIPEDHEICDKCHKLLDKRKMEDIYLEPLNMVLCGSCNNEHKGIGKYWSSRSVQEYYENQTVTEWCPHCDQEVELKQKFEKQIYPNCKEGILPCAQCETQNCKECPLTVEHKEFTLYYEIAKPMTINIKETSIEKAISKFYKMDAKALEERGDGNDPEIILDNFFMINGKTEETR